MVDKQVYVCIFAVTWKIQKFENHTAVS